MEFPTKAYLECEDLGIGMFSSERILSFSNSKGELIEGFFDNANLENGLGLKVTAVGESFNCVQIIIPQNEVCGKGISAGGLYSVKRENIIYERELERPN